jgi:large subunit ribosomal protein L7/L12
MPPLNREWEITVRVSAVCQGEQLVNQKRKDRIQALAGKLKQLQAQETKAELRQRSKLARKSRKDDLRRKILAGAVALTCVEDGRLSKKDFYAWLDLALENPEDRALFDLGIRGERSTIDGMPETRMSVARVATDSEGPGHDPESAC